jgi:drug/metabolite transporter (DMT)-like permease
MLGYVIAKDSCEHWSAYWIGTICVVLGLFLYRFDMFQEWNKSSVDLVTLLSIGSVILSSVDATVRKRYRNTFSIDQANAARSVFMGAIFISCVWMLGEVIFYGTSPCPRTAREWMAVIYLGVVPTAIANILFNKAEDTLSIPITQSIYCLSPFAALVVSMIPVPFFTMSHQHLSTKHYIGLVITVMGSIIVARFAGVKRRT